MHALYLSSVLLHILAATAWIGAMFFLMLIVVPMLRRGDRAQGAAFLSASGPRLRAMAWASFAVLFLTGLYNLSRRGVHLEDLTRPEWVASSFGHLVLLKLALFVAVVGLSAIHDFRIGPNAARAMAKAPTSEEARRLRLMASVMGRANALLALVILAVAVMLVRGAP